MEIINEYISIFTGYPMGTNGDNMFEPIQYYHDKILLIDTEIHEMGTYQPGWFINQLVPS